MKKLTAAFALALAVGTAAGCATGGGKLAQGSDQISPHITNYRDNAAANYPINFSPKNYYENNRRSVDQLEQAVRAVPGVTDAKIVPYGTNSLMIGVSTNGRERHTIVRRIRNQLIPEARNTNLYISTKPKLYDAIAKVRTQTLQQGSIPYDDLQHLMNEVADEVRPWNLMEKS